LTSYDDNNPGVTADYDRYYNNVDAVKWLGIRASKEPLDVLQNLLKHGFLNRGDIPILRRFIRHIRACDEELLPGYKEEGYEIALVVKEAVIAELEGIISMILLIDEMK